MKRDAQHSLVKGPAGLDSFYQGQWRDRWLALRTALLADATKYKFENPYALGAAASAGLREYYELDPASVLVARMVRATPGQRVLDMCAAPGGKSLVQIFDAAAAALAPIEWHLNDLSRDRAFRLKKVLNEYLPLSVCERLRVTSFDASQFGLHKAEFFDRILLDAPCSGERHVFEDQKALAEWSPQRSKGLASRQYALFCSAELALRPGGRLIYSTCSISSLENDDVISRFFERRAKKGAVKLRTLSRDEIFNDGKSSSTAGASSSPAFLPGRLTTLQDWSRSHHLELEPTVHGFSILPDRSRGAGPMYFSVLEKAP